LVASTVSKKYSGSGIIPSVAALLLGA